METPPNPTAPQEILELPEGPRFAVETHRITEAVNNRGFIIARGLRTKVTGFPAGMTIDVPVYLSLVTAFPNYAEPPACIDADGTPWWIGRYADGFYFRCRKGTEIKNPVQHKSPQRSPDNLPSLPHGTSGFHV